MTNLLDLPNELLLMIAVGGYYKSRRILSKTCRRIFYLIRGHHDQKRFGIRGKDRFQMRLQQFSADAFVLRVREYEDIRKPQMPHTGTFDVRVLVIVPESTVVVPAIVPVILNACTVPKSKISLIRCTDIYTETVEMLLEGNEIFNIRELIYEASFGVFHLQYAREIFKINNRCSFVVFNHGFFNESVHQLLESLLTEWIEFAYSQRSREDVSCQQIHVSEVFTRNCCRPVAEEISRINHSSRNLLKKVRSYSTANAKGDDYPDSIRRRPSRTFIVVLHENGSLKSSVDNTKVRSVSQSRQHCIHYNRQLLPSQAFDLLENLQLRHPSDLSFERELLNNQRELVNKQWQKVAGILRLSRVAARVATRNATYVATRDAPYVATRDATRDACAVKYLRRMITLLKDMIKLQRGMETRLQQMQDADARIQHQHDTLMEQWRQYVPHTQEQKFIELRFSY